MSHSTRKLLHVTNKVADQPAHPRSLISAIAIRLLESMIAKVATCKLSIFLLVAVAEQTGKFGHYLVGNHKEMFSRNPGHALMLNLYLSLPYWTSQCAHIAIGQGTSL